MKTGQGKYGKLAIASDILAYLAEHPQAQDTLEGVMQWWLLEQRIKQLMAEVKVALDELVAEGLVLEHQGADGQVRYGVNSQKTEQIRAKLAQGKKRSKKRPPA